MKRFFTAGLIGAAAAYFLDPTAGSQRRNAMGGRLTSLFRRGGQQIQSQVQSVGGQAQGFAQATSAPPDNPNPDDLTLRDRVESEIFRNTETSRENINVNVVDGVVTVRGELPSQQEIDGLVQQIKSIRNVKGVTNFLHLPGTPAPNKESALEAS